MPELGPRRVISETFQVIASTSHIHVTGRSSHSEGRNPLELAGWSRGHDWRRGWTEWNMQ